MSAAASVAISVATLTLHPAIDPSVAETRLVLARFFAEQQLPAASGFGAAAMAGSGDLFALDAAQLADTTPVAAR